MAEGSQREKATERHQLKVLFALAAQQSERKLCDVDIHAGGRIFPAHRCVLAASSEYFEALFTTDMLEKSSSSISIEMTASVVQEVINFAYTGLIDLNENNARDILGAADYLIISDLKERAAEFLAASLAPENCLEIRQISERCACPSLLNAAVAYSLRNFSRVWRTCEFKSVPFEVVEELTSNDEVVVGGEEEVYEAIVAWANYDKGKRTAHFEKLFRNVRLFSMPRDYIRFNLERETLITNSLPCMNHLVQGLKALAFCESEEHETVANQPRRCLASRDCVVVAPGGRSDGRSQKRTLAYDAGTKTWLEMPPMMTDREEHAVVVCGEFLYVIGGNYPRGKSVERYDACANTWSPVPDLPEGVFGSAAVAFDGAIYVLGGKDGFQATTVVQRFDANASTWAVQLPLKHARKALCAAVVGGCLYAIGGCTTDSNSLKVVEKFAPGAEDWVKVTSLSQDRKYACAEVLDDKIVVIGGYQMTSTEALRSCEVYSPCADEWYPLADLSVPRGAAGAAVLGNAIFVVGGRHNRQYVTSVECYEQETAAWRLDTDGMPLACAWFQCGVVRLTKRMRANLQGQTLVKL